MNIKTKKCFDCGKIKFTSEFSKNKSRHDGLQHRCKKCRSENYQKNKQSVLNQTREWRKNNISKYTENKKKYYKENKNKIIESTMKWRSVNKEKFKLNWQRWRIETKEARSIAASLYYQSHKSYFINKSRVRKNKIKISSWDFERDIINEFYKNCPDGYHVDHIIPIVGKINGVHVVSGLHVLCNLQYLPAKENLSKGCLFTP